MKTVIAMAAFTVIVFAAGYLTRWAQDGWHRATRDIDQAIGLVCKACSWTDPTAPCTCPDKGCTATVCPRRGVRRG